MICANVVSGGHLAAKSGEAHMKVIQTEYKGLKYRSRTEARWAVVFDVLGWQHHYEPNGFELPSGGYFPDFYLPDVDAYFEVKGREPSAQERLKAEELCVSEQTTVIVSTGPPNPNRREWNEDLITFSPDSLDGIEFFADENRGGFVSRRREEHPACSLHLGNLIYLGANKEVGWECAFRASANHRFGLFA
jgi:hypothetical protein